MMMTYEELLRVEEEMFREFDKMIPPFVYRDNAYSDAEQSYFQEAIGTLANEAACDNALPLAAVEFALSKLTNYAPLTGMQKLKKDLFD